MKPLEGVKILDFTQFFSGPLCTMILADYGAEVIKLENPPYGDNTRYNPGLTEKNGIYGSTNFAGRNRGKKSVLMNLKDEKQKALFLEMVKTADAVVENFKPGTMQKYGLDYETLKAVNPKIVYTSISGYGQTGPWSKRAAYDLAVQASAGIMSITGEENGNPLKVGSSVADYSAGLYGCIGTLMGIYGAKMTGEGRRVDVAMMDAIIVLLDNVLSRYCLSGKTPKPQGNRHPTAVPFRPFTCKDGEQVIVGISTDEQWQRFCKILGREELAKDPKYISFSRRFENRDEVEAVVEKEMAKWNAPDICEKLEQEALVYAQINNVAQVAGHPQTKARNMIVTAEFPDGPALRIPGRPIKMSDVDDETEFFLHTLGSDTVDVMKQYADAKTVEKIYRDVLDNSAKAVKEKYGKV